jgi:hypothetical protein
MQLSDRRALGHLTYCTNIHAAETWPEVEAALRQHLPAIRSQAAPGRPFGVGLRLAASAAEALQAPGAMAELQALLADEDCYVFTLNGFPFGSFHGKRVKQDVYAPDWATEERLTYTNRLADILARLLPEGMAGSVSTVPGTFGAWAEGRIEAIVTNFVRHAAYLTELESRTGRNIALALEPEPRCLLETIEETAAFFETRLFGDLAVARMAELTGLPRTSAADELRRRLGVCYDVCHAAVEFEDVRGSLELLRAKGISIPKLQLSAALKVERIDRETAERLRPFDEPIYLHQVVARNGAGLSRYVDLPDALADLGRTLGGEWRVHFHVPIFLDRMEHFSTTQDFLSDILALHREQPISDHLEVETYTWDVLPERYRSTPVAEAIARELAWVRQQLDA